MQRVVFDENKWFVTDRFSLERLILEKAGVNWKEQANHFDTSKVLFDDCSWSNNTWEALAEASDDRCVNESVGVNSLQSEVRYIITLRVYSK